MSRLRVLALLAMVLVAQALAAEDAADDSEDAAAKEPNLYDRPSHFNMEMIRLGTVAAFLVVAALLGIVVWKTCSWPRLV